MTELRPVTRENIEALLALKVHEHQNSFVSTAAESLAQAYVYYEAKGYYTLWKFFIDKDHQHRGIGREALALGISFLKEKFCVSAIYTGVVPENTVAKHLYRSAGFAFTGNCEDGMEEWCLKCPT